MTAIRKKQKDKSLDSVGGSKHMGKRGESYLFHCEGGEGHFQQWALLKSAPSTSGPFSGKTGSQKLPRGGETQQEGSQTYRLGNGRHGCLMLEFFDPLQMGGSREGSVEKGGGPSLVGEKGGRAGGDLPHNMCTRSKENPEGTWGLQV